MLREVGVVEVLEWDNPVRTFLLPLDRAHVGLVGALARGEAGTEKQGGEEEQAFHGEEDIV